jgi:maltose alpha-D-glucosyltransferase/alpha-amylase
MNSLLLSMPGSPILYYGDEIGMGDNVYLGDRNGVRTPMQWSPERNAGFSRVDPQRLFLPPIMDPVYGYQAVNVEAQSRDPSSLLNWTRRLLAVRKGHKVFGRGKLRFLRAGNRKILAYLREYEDESILCVANLARSAQPVELDLSEYKGRMPVELMGRAVFPPVGDLPYLLTLPGHSFYWFRLAKGEEMPAWHEERLPKEELPVLVLFDGWRSFFRDRVVPWRISLAEKVRTQLEREVLPQFMMTQRWYAAKGEALDRVVLTDHLEWDGEGGNWLLALFHTESEGRKASTYFLPLALMWENDTEDHLRRMAPLTMAKVRQQAQVGVLGDAFGDEQFCRAVVAAIAGKRELRCAHGKLRFSPTKAFSELAGPSFNTLPVRMPGAQSSNTIVVMDERLFLKGYRRLQAGINPEAEIGRFLTESAHFSHSVPVAGMLEYVADDGSVMTLALLQSYVENQGDGWNYTKDYLVRCFELREPLSSTAEHQSAGTAAEEHGAYLQLVRILGRRTAELHVALATKTGDPAFEPEPIEDKDIAGWVKQVHEEANAVMDRLEGRRGSLAESVRGEADVLLQRRKALLARIEACAPRQVHGIKIRHHGDYHLGQVLLKQNDFIITDFEGEPGRTFVERRQKHSPLRDVAGMLRSFNYAMHAALLHVAELHPQELASLEARGGKWESEVKEAFLSAYRQTAEASGLYSSWEEVRGLLELFLLEKAFYELRYEIDNRPGWVRVPLRGIVSLAELAL